jgi:nitrogen fixation NifU-like protein
MSGLRELYQETIIDHSKQPRNFGVLPTANHHKEGFNPLCGDRLMLYVDEKEGVVTASRFTGCGCAISVASASLMTEVIQGKTVAEVETIFSAFHELVTTANSKSEINLGKLTVLAGVSEYPARVKCATLAWHTLMAALKNEDAPVSTE